MQKSVEVIIIDRLAAEISPAWVSFGRNHEILIFGVQTKRMLPAGAVETMFPGYAGQTEVLAAFKVNLKYRTIIDELCPGGSCPPAEVAPVSTDAYRWVYNPKEDVRNFLPNYELDKLQNRLAPYTNGFYNATRKCSRCAQSMYTSLDAAKIAYSKLSLSIRQKLNYTHVAKGVLGPGDGVATVPDYTEHFTLFEAQNTDLRIKFEICDELPALT